MSGNVRASVTNFIILGLGLGNRIMVGVSIRVRVSFRVSIKLIRYSAIYRVNGCRKHNLAMSIRRHRKYSHFVIVMSVRWEAQYYPVISYDS